MPILRINEFKGTRPQVSAKLLPANFAQTAENCDLREGSLKPFYKTGYLAQILKASPATIFKCGTKWDAWALYVNVVRSWIYDANARFYVTDGVHPKQTKLDLINDCTLSAVASTFYYLGVNAPNTAPSMTFVYNGGTPGDDIQATISYVFTYVTSWDEESAPSPASAPAEIYEDGYCTVSCPTPTGERPADSLITAIRIYRISTGTTGADYEFLAEVNISGTPTTYDDRDGSNWAITPEADLGEVIETEGYDEPPNGLEGLTALSNGLMAGFLNNEVYINEPFIPYAFPSEYKKEVESDVVALAYIPATTTLVITTQTHPYICQGTDPQSMVPFPLPEQGANLSEHGAVSTPEGVIYPSPSGLVLVNNSGAKLVTKDEYGNGVITPKQWMSYNPATLVAAYWAGKYIGFFKNTNTGIIYDFKQFYFVDLTLNNYPDTYAITIKNLYLDPATDTLYILAYSADTNYYILSFDGHASELLTATWKSKKYFVDYLSTYSCARIKADFGTVTFKLYSGPTPTLRQTKSATSDDIFRTPSGFTNYEWEQQVETEVQVDEIALATVPDDFFGEEATE